MSSTTPSTDRLETRFNAAVWLAREAGERTLTRFQTSQLGVESKRDGTPVTIADRDAEKFLRERIAEEFPDDGVLGEEYGETIGTSGIRWILDPIDGTKAFVCGVPLYGTLVAVEVDGAAAIGVIELPALNERVYGCAGAGAFWQKGDRTPEKARVSGARDLADAVFCFTDAALFEKRQSRPFLSMLESNCRLTRGWNDCYAYALLATGRCDVVVDPIMELWDVAALAPIIREAGGRLTDWNGNDGLARDCIATNGLLHDAVVKCARTSCGRHAH